MIVVIVLQAIGVPAVYGPYNSDEYEQADIAVRQWQDLGEQAYSIDVQDRPSMMLDIADLRDGRYRFW